MLAKQNPKIQCSLVKNVQLAEEGNIYTGNNPSVENKTNNYWQLRCDQCIRDSKCLRLSSARQKLSTGTDPHFLFIWDKMSSVLTCVLAGVHSCAPGSSPE